MEFIDGCVNPILYLDYSCVGCQYAFRCNFILNPSDKRKKAPNIELLELKRGSNIKCSTCNNVATISVKHLTNFLCCNNCLEEYFDGIDDNKKISYIRRLGLKNYKLKKTSLKENKNKERIADQLELF